jgi:hypothetical protein
MQAHATKIVFLGGVFAYALPRNDSFALLVCPFAAFVFDCIAYGLTYNIQEIGAYIRDHIEPALPQAHAQLPGYAGTSRFLYWETAKRHPTRPDWGRLFARLGNYAVTFLACVVAFTKSWPHIRVGIAVGLLFGVVALYVLLIVFEVRTRDLSRGVAIASASSPD